MAETRTARMVFRVGLSAEEYVLPTERFDPGADLLAYDVLASQAKTDADAVVASREGGRWEKHREKGREMIGFGERFLRKLLHTQSKVDDSVRTVAKMNDAGGDPGAVPDDLDPNDLIEHLRAQLGDEMAAAIPDAAYFESELESGLRSPSSFDLDLADSAGATLWADLLEAQRNLGIWYVAAGYEELFRADFFAAIDAATPDPRPQAALDAIEREVEQLDGEVTARFQSLYGSIAAADWGRVESRSRQSISYPFEIHDDLVRLGTTLRRARMARDRSDEWHADNDVMEIGQIEARLHEVTWKLTMLLAASYRFLFVARQRTGHPEAEAEVEAARETRFGSLVDRGESVDLDHLLGDPDAYDGALVETGGFVEDLWYDPDAPGSKFELVDVWNDRRVRVFLPFRNLNHWSIREGAYVRLHGAFAAESEHLDGDPEIELDVVGVGEHADESWLDHVARSLEADDVFDRYPSRTNAYWSLEPPADETTMTDGGSNASDDGGDGNGSNDGSDGGSDGDAGGGGSPDGGNGSSGSGGGSSGGGHTCPIPPIDWDDFDVEDGDVKYDLSDQWKLYGTGGADPPRVEVGIEYRW